ncbi:MAG: M28 family peptidase [Planctomycetota bacterium]
MRTPLMFGFIVMTALPAVAEPKSDVLDFEADHRVFTQHIYYLANDFMDGRVPGSRGAEIARQYAETAFERSGLTPAFAETLTAEDGTETEQPFASWRQPFALGGRVEVKLAEFSANGQAFTHERDFVVTGLGGEGTLSGDAVFVGYSIDDGNDGFTSYPEGTDLTGKLAVMLRFEPMDDSGMSLWTEDDGWSNSASFDNKLRAAFDRGAAGAVVINTPGADDDRINRLDAFRGSGLGAEQPVFLMSQDAGTRWLEGATGMSIADLIENANEGGSVMSIDGGVNLAADVEREAVFAENVGGVLWGQGDLKDEWIVMGAHIDHIGMGDFGSRWGSGKLHPGADDNASGTAGVLLLADLLARSYAELPENADARSIVFIAFDAEESGLNGSRYYVNNPIAPLEDHAIMTNFDMIGRITDDRVLLSGLETGEGLQDLLQPAMDKSELELVIPSSMNGASDHSSFLARGIPVLFSIIADFHDDYHTPDDVVWKINTADATRTCHLYHDMVMILSSSEKPELVSSGGRSNQGVRMGNISVRFGVSPQYSGEGPGIGIASVAEGGSADVAGVQAGDRLVRWDGQKLSDVEGWMPLLASHEPGDVINIGVLRDGEEVTLEVTLQAR